MAKTLPKWLSRNESGAFVVDPDLAYPEILKALGVKDKDIDQYWIEVTYQCAKLHVQNLVEGTELDPRPNLPFVISIHGHDGRKTRWGLVNFPKGRGVEAATKGKEAIAHYQRIAQAL